MMYRIRAIAMALLTNSPTLSPFMARWYTILPPHRMHFSWSMFSSPWLSDWNVTFFAFGVSA